MSAKRNCPVDSESESSKNKNPKQVRVWVDGCFDMVHFGHANALRQAKQMGDKLVVGVYSDDEILHHKGPPVFNEDERCKIVGAIKWVDEVVKGVPFVTTVETLDANNCDFSAHGDDYTTTADGKDSFHDVKAAGRYQEYKRTLGISTTGLVDSIAGPDLLNKLPEEKRKASSSIFAKPSLVVYQCYHTDYDYVYDLAMSCLRDCTGKSPYTGTEEYLPITGRISQFSDGNEPKQGDKIVYVTGAFDLFHVGHLDFLEKAAQQGDFLIVGVQSDADVERSHGSNYPIMTLHERVLSVLTNKFVSEVVIGAPFKVTAHIMDHFNIDLVCHGASSVPVHEDGSDPYAEPKRRNKFKVVDSGNPLTTADIVKRIKQNRSEYEIRNRKKEAKEAKYFTKENDKN